MARVIADFSGVVPSVNGGGSPLTVRCERGGVSAQLKFRLRTDTPNYERAAPNDLALLSDRARLRVSGGEWQEWGADLPLPSVVDYDGLTCYIQFRSFPEDTGDSVALNGLLIVQEHNVLLQQFVVYYGRGTARSTSGATGAATARAVASGTAGSVSGAEGYAAITSDTAARGTAQTVSGAEGAATSREIGAGTAGSTSGAQGVVQEREKATGTAGSTSGAQGAAAINTPVVPKDYFPYATSGNMVASAPTQNPLGASLQDPNMGLAHVEARFGSGSWVDIGAVFGDQTGITYFTRTGTLTAAGGETTISVRLNDGAGGYVPLSSGYTWTLRSAATAGTKNVSIRLARDSDDELYEYVSLACGSYAWTER